MMSFLVKKFNRLGQHTADKDPNLIWGIDARKWQSGSMMMDREIDGEQAMVVTILSSAVYRLETPAIQNATQGFIRKQS